MISRVKYAFSAPGEQVVYESEKEFDGMVDHTSYWQLRWHLYRVNDYVAAIYQGNVEITRYTYHLMQPEKRVLVLYKPKTLYC